VGAFAADAAAAADTTSTARAFTRRKPVRKPFPDHLPRERVVVEAPTTCTCCGSHRIVKMSAPSHPLQHAPEGHWTRVSLLMLASFLSMHVGSDHTRLGNLRFGLKRSRAKQPSTESR